MQKNPPKNCSGFYNVIYIYIDIHIRVYHRCSVCGAAFLGVGSMGCSANGFCSLYATVCLTAAKDDIGT